MNSSGVGEVEGEIVVEVIEDVEVGTVLDRDKVTGAVRVPTRALLVGAISQLLARCSA